MTSITWRLRTLRLRANSNWPQGFACFSLEVVNAGSGNLSPEQLASFEHALGCRIRKIPQHF